MSTSIYIICLFFIFSACKRSSFQNDLNADKLIRINSPAKLNISDLVYDIDTIRLETNDESVMNNISNMHIMNNKFYILANNHTVIKIFDYNGKYLSQINNHGNGPDEYIRISSFKVDKLNNRIIIADSFSRRIFAYDQYGKQLQNIKLDFEPITILPYDDAFINIYSGPRGIYENADMENRNIHFLDKKGKFISSAIEIDTPNSINISSMFQTGITENGEILFQPVLSEVIYQIKDNYEVILLYAFVNNSSYNLLTLSEKNKFQFEYDRKNSFEDKEDSKYLLTWGEVLDLTDYTLFLFSGWNKKKYLYYSKEFEDALFIDPQYISGDPGLKEIFLSYPKAVKGNKFFTTVHPMTIENVKDKLPEGKVKSFLNKTDIDSNPILISYSIRFIKSNSN